MTSSNIEICMFYKMYFTENDGKCVDQAGWKIAHSGQYLCYSHATTSFKPMTKIVCVCRRVPLDD